jgi:hypothetical protein
MQCVMLVDSPVKYLANKHVFIVVHRYYIQQPCSEKTTQLPQATTEPQQAAGYSKYVAARQVTMYLGAAGKTFVY